MSKFWKTFGISLITIPILAVFYLIYDQVGGLLQYKEKVLGLASNYVGLQQQYQDYKEQTKNLSSKTNQIAEIINTYGAKAESDSAAAEFDSAKVNGDLSIYYKNLTNNESVIVDEDIKYYMASLYKVILTIFILDEIKNGKTTFDTKIGTSSSTLETGLNRIITESNNEYAQMLAQEYGWKTIEGEMKKKLGIDFSFNEDLEINIKNVGLLFEDIALSLKVTGDQSSYLLNLLKDQKKTSKLPKYLPASTYIHNKTGEFEDYSHDAGIFYTPKANYILIFMSKTQNPSETNEQMAQMSKAIYESLNKQ